MKPQDERPNPADPDSWPSVRLSDVAGSLASALAAITAVEGLATALGVPSGTASAARWAVEQARDVLAALEAISPLAAWRILHPPRLDPLDAVYDCGNPDCPATGFASPEDRDLHYRRWDLG